LCSLFSEEAAYTHRRGERKIGSGAKKNDESEPNINQDEFVMSPGDQSFGERAQGKKKNAKKKKEKTGETKIEWGKRNSSTATQGDRYSLLLSTMTM